MIRAWLSFVLFLAPWAAGQAAGPINVKIRVMLAESSGKAGSGTFDFYKDAAPGAGKEFKIRVDSERSGSISAVAFNSLGEIAFDGGETARFFPGISIVLPAQRRWTWEGPEHLTEVDIVAAQVGASDYRDYEDLLTKMKQPGLPPEIRTMQAGSLRKWIDAHLRSSASAADYSVKDQPTEVGGLIRGAEKAHTLSIPSGGSAVFRLRLPQ